MLRRTFLAGLLSACGLSRASEDQPQSLRGKLVSGPALELGGHQRVSLTSDDPTLAVLKDARLAGVDLEVVGRHTAPDRFEVQHIHKRALFVHQRGKRLLITYWCDVCYIRTFSPGLCWCCQKYTDLDLRENLDQP